MDEDILDQKDAKPIYCWILGHGDLDSRFIDSIFFCQYTLESLPPQHQWSYVGLYMNKDAERVECPDLDSIRNDRIKLAYGTLEGKVLSRPFASNRSCKISGCSYDQLNGRYIEVDNYNDCPVYKNVWDWMLFRYMVKEIPGLNILVSNSYSSLLSHMSPPIQERADIAVTELVSLNSSVEEGTSYFKRKFADIKKVSYRAMLGDDHDISQLDLSTKLSSNTDDIAMMLHGDLTSNEYLNQNNFNVSITMQKRHTSKDKKSELLHEAYVTKQLLKLIESREISLKELDDFITNAHDGKTVTSERFTSSEANTLVFKLIESSKLVIDRIRQWETVCASKGLEQNITHLKAAASNHVKQYCVIITGDSRELYKASPPIHSKVARINRGLEPARRHTDIIFVGTFESQEDAKNAFNNSIMKSIRGNVNDKADYDTTIYVSMRPCLKHILFRSRGVPKDVPCESCVALHCQDNNVMGTGELRFTWRGLDYLNKIRSDFLRLSSQFPSLSDLNMNWSMLESNCDDYSTVSILQRNSDGCHGRNMLSSSTSIFSRTKFRTLSTDKYISQSKLCDLSQSNNLSVSRINSHSGDSVFEGLSKRKHVRAFLREEALIAKGKQKLKQINRMQRLLRTCVQAGVGVWKVDDVRNLINSAKALNNHALVIDIATAERHLSKTLSVIACVRKIQAVYRGYRGRCTFFELVCMRNFRQELMKLREKTAKKLSVEFVSSVTNMCIASLSKTLVKPYFVRTITSNNHCYLINVKLESSPLVKSPNICNSCLLANSYMYVPGKCTCQLQQRPEHWRIELHEPISGECRNILVSSQYIISAVNLASMGGRSWGNFALDYDESSDGSIVSPHEGNLRRLSSHIYAIADVEKESDQRMGWLPPTRTLDIPKSRTSEFMWEPIHDIIMSSLQLRDYRCYIESMQNKLIRISQAYEELDLHRQEEKLILYEQSCFSYEDALSNLHNLSEAYLLAENRIRNVMDVSLLSAVTALDDADTAIDDVNWRKSWTAFIDGNAWAGLNCKRKIEALIAKNSDLRNSLLADCIFLKSELDEVIETRAVKKKQLSSLKDSMKLCEEELRSLEQNFKVKKDFVGLAASVVVQSLPIPRIWNDNICLPSSLNRLSSTNVDKYHWNLLRREIITVYRRLDGTMISINDFSHYGLCERLQYLIEIYECPMQNALILHISGNSLEENVQHLDFQDYCHYKVLENKREVEKSTMIGIESDVTTSPLTTLSSESALIAIMSKIDNNSDSFYSFPRNVEIRTSRQKINPLKLVKSANTNRHLNSRIYRGYLHLHESRKMEQEEYIQSILSSIRVHPHSRRPCVGTTIFKYRRSNLELLLKSTACFRDLQTLNPLITMHLIEMRESIFLISNRLYNVIFLWKMSELEIHITDCWSAKSAMMLTISLSDILRSLQSSPMLKAVFLNNHIVNRYNRIIEKFIADHIVISKSSSHSTMSNHKNSVVTYVCNKFSVSSVFSCYRMINSLWFYVSIEEYQDATCRITLSTPNELKNFPDLVPLCELYQGKVIYLCLDNFDIKKLLWKIYVNHNNSRVDIFSIQNRELLYTVILETLNINDIKNSRNTSLAESRITGSKKFLNLTDEDISIKIASTEENFVEWLKRRCPDYRFPAFSHEENDDNWCFISDKRLVGDANLGSIQISRQISTIPVRFDDTQASAWVRKESYERSLLTCDIIAERLSRNRPKKPVLVIMSRKTINQQATVYNISFSSDASLFDDVYASKERLSMEFEDKLSEQLKQVEIREKFEAAIHRMLKYYRDKLSFHTNELRINHDLHASLYTRLSDVNASFHDKLLRSIKYIGNVEPQRMKYDEKADQFHEQIDSLKIFMSRIISCLQPKEDSKLFAVHCSKDDYMNNIIKYKTSISDETYRNPLSWYRVRDILHRSSNRDIESRVQMHYHNRRLADRDRRLLQLYSNDSCNNSNESFQTVTGVSYNDENHERDQMELEMIRSYFAEASEHIASRISERFMSLQEIVRIYKQVVDHLDDLLLGDEVDINAIIEFGSDPITDECFIDRNTIIEPSSTWLNGSGQLSTTSMESPLIDPTEQPFIYGIYIPCNKQMDVVPFITKTSAQFLEICNHSLHCASYGLSRFMNARFCIYNSQGIFDRKFLENIESRPECDRRLLRLNTILQLKNERVATIYHKLINQSRESFNDNRVNPEPSGDVVIMLRKGKEDFDTILKILNMKSLIPDNDETHLFIEKSLGHYKDEKQDLDYLSQAIMISRFKRNHQQFIAELFTSCRPFLHAFERIINPVVSPPNGEEYLDIIKLLSSYRKIVYGDEECFNQYLQQQACMLEERFARSSLDQLRMFDEAPSIDEDTVRAIMRSQFGYPVIPSTSTLPNIVHITHTLFALHCSSCKYKNKCRISICKRYHQLCIGKDEDISSETIPIGLNQILCDRQLHQFIMKNAYDEILIMSKGMTSFLTRENVSTQSNDNDHRKKDEGKLCWRQLFIESARMTHLYHQNIPPPMRGIFQDQSTRSDGFYYNQRPFSLEFHENLTPEDERLINFPDQVIDTNCDKIPTASQLQDSHSIPNISFSEETIFKLLSHAWYSPFIRHGSSSSITSVQETVDAIKIAQRVHEIIIPRLELNYRYQNRIIIDFDRLLEERVIAFSDHLVTIRVLMGIIRDENNGSSHRYCEVKDLDTMLYGFTIVILCNSSASPRIVNVESQTCSRLVELLKLHRGLICNNMLELVSRFLDHASLMLHLKYLQGQLVDVEFNVLWLIEAKEKSKESENIKASSHEVKTSNSRRYRIEGSSIAMKINNLINFL